MYNFFDLDEMRRNIEIQFGWCCAESAQSQDYDPSFGSRILQVRHLGKLDCHADERASSVQFGDCQLQFRIVSVI